MLMSNLTYPPLQLARLQNGWSTHSQATTPLGIQYVAECESTNAQLYSSTRQHNTLLVTERQSHGKGQFERAWVSVAGDLIFSLGLTLPLAQLPALSLRIGLALTQVFAQHSLSTQLKWANDVIAQHPDTGQRGKLAGILVQSQPAHHGHAWVVIGVGVNVAPRLLPQQINASAFAPIGLAQLAPQWSTPEAGAREALLIALVDTILVHIETAALNQDLPKLWNAHDIWRGQAVTLTDPQGAEHHGTAAGIAPSGAYQLKLDSNGTLKAFVSGQLRARS